MYNNKFNEEVTPLLLISLAIKGQSQNNMIKAEYRVSFLSLFSLVFLDEALEFIQFSPKYKYFFQESFIVGTYTFVNIIPRYNVIK